MAGTILLFRDDGSRPRCEIALENGDRVRLVLDADGLAITRIAPTSESNDILFHAAPATVAGICAGLVGPKRQSGASPLQILAATVQRIGSAAEVRSAFAEATTRLG